MTTTKLIAELRRLADNIEASQGDVGTMMLISLAADELDRLTRERDEARRSCERLITEKHMTARDIENLEKRVSEIEFERLPYGLSPPLEICTPDGRPIR